ncbi:Fibroblast growth factor-binding protein 1 [Merluccius polli]|uniref:Fibroblast growth factor-binding protein 1 n=1 Tax=Merluccius polli TaxID=89951 RepID=A0AA47NCR2_MERPO|nr:Fibroblast growth factor-binding protein 1 [Merluccius polli]
MKFMIRRIVTVNTVAARWDQELFRRPSGITGLQSRRRTWPSSCTSLSSWSWDVCRCRFPPAPVRRPEEGAEPERKFSSQTHPSILPSPPPPPPLDRVSGSPLKGRFASKDKLRCQWVAAAGQDYDDVVLGVSCTKNGQRLSCEYLAKPAACRRYASRQGLYWKQVVRALKKQRTLCRGGALVLRAGVCRTAAEVSHFRLRVPPGFDPTPSPSPSPPPAGVKSCRVAHQQLADDYCNDSWSTLCVFFFTFVQNEDCSE